MPQISHAHPALAQRSVWYSAWYLLGDTMLTTKAIAAAKPTGKGYKLTDGGGLYLYVTAVGGKSWRANFTRGGKQGTKTYGMWPAMGPQEARKAHAQAADAPAPAPTFGEVAKLWLAAKIPTLTNVKHQGQVQNTLERYVLPSIGDLPVNSIPRTKLVEVSRAAQSGNKLETGHRVAGRITAVFDYAMDTGLIEHHGAASLVRVLIPRKVKKPMASIPPAEAGALLRAIDGYDEPVTRLALRLLALIFVRPGNEFRLMRWDEFKEDGAIWLVPGERMKIKVPHVVPLAPQAQNIIAELKVLNGESDYVFESPIRRGHSISENTLLFALYRFGYRGRMTAHGFRALASTVLHEQSGFASEVIERQLAHKETDEVKAAYNRAQHLPQRRELMKWWGNWLDSQRCASQTPATE